MIATELLWWHWFVAGLILMALELVVPSFVIIWFGVAGVVVGVALLVVPLSLTGQLALWLAVAMLLLVLWFRVWRPHEHRTAADTVTDAQSIVGEVGLLTRPVAPFQRGEVLLQKPVLGSDRWPCRAETTIAAGERVQVVAVEGGELLVAPFRPRNKEVCDER